MASGIQFPFQADAYGRLAIVDGEENLRKIILLNLSACPSANPFQDLGIGLEAIFDLNDESVRARLANRVKQVFKRLAAQGRARLATGYPRFQINPFDTAELLIEVKYINLETRTEEEMLLDFESALPQIRSL